MVLFYVLLLAAPVLVIAVWTKSKILLTIAAIFAVIVGVATGNPVYMFEDIVGVALAFGFGRSFINSQKLLVQSQKKQPLPAPEKKGEDSFFTVSVFIVVIVALFLYNKIADKPVSSPATIVQVPRQVNATSDSQQSTQGGQQANSTIKSANKVSRAGSDLRHCLNLLTDAEISRCANQGK